MFSCATPAAAQGIAPFTFGLGNAEAVLGGSVEGAVFAASQPGQRDSGTGAATLTGTIRRDYDSGLALSLNTALSLHDPLSLGRYDGDLLEILYGQVRTGLGTMRLGLVDGAGASLAVVGPRADAGVALDDPAVSFFRDPSGRALTQIFTLRSPVGGTANYAKLTFETPELFGVTLGFSYTPSMSKTVLPFLHVGPSAPGRQTDMWEMALRYVTEYDISDDSFLTLSASGAGILGTAQNKLPGQEGMEDFGFGARADYGIGEDWTFSLGGNWRRSNGHAFDPLRSYQGADTRLHAISFGITYAQWSLSLEEGGGVAQAAFGHPRLGLNGKQITFAYNVTPSLTFSTGWQRQDISRDTGRFYDGGNRLTLDAAFLRVSVRTADP